MAALDKVEVVDKYTVKFTLKEPYVWFLDMVANPMALAIIAQGGRREVRRPQEARGGDRHRARGCSTATGRTSASPSCGTRATSCAGLPYIDKVEVTVDEDNASRMAAFIAGKYDLGWESLGHHQPGGLGADQGHAQAEAAEAPDDGVRRQPDEPHLHAHRQAAVQRRARAPRHLAGLRPPGHPRRRRRGRRRLQPGGARGASRSGRCPSTSSARAPSTTSTIPRGPRSSSPRPAIPTASRPRSPTRPTAPPSWSTRCSSC